MIYPVDRMIMADRDLSRYRIMASYVLMLYRCFASIKQLYIFQSVNFELIIYNVTPLLRAPLHSSTLYLLYIEC